jgi:hypothetical protein
MESFNQEVYASIGYFLVSYERVQALMKSVIIQETVIPGFKKGTGKDTSATKTILKFKEFLQDNYSADIIKYAKEYDLLLSKIDSLNKIRNNILHGLVTPSLTMDQELAIIFTHHHLYEDNCYNIISFKIPISVMHRYISGAHIIYKLFVDLLNNKLFKRNQNLFDGIDFIPLQQCDFSISPLLEV